MNMMDDFEFRFRTHILNEKLKIQQEKVRKLSTELLKALWDCCEEDSAPLGFWDSEIYYELQRRGEEPQL